MINRRGWDIIPRDIAKNIQLRMPGQFTLGRLIIFPSFWWLPFKARFLNWLKLLLKTVGLFNVIRHLRKRNINDETILSESDRYSPEHNSDWNALPNHQEFDFAIKQHHRFRPEVVITCYGWINPVLEKLRNHHDCYRIVLHPDVWHNRWNKGANQKLEVLEAGLSRAEESQLLSYSDLIVAISKEDARIFKDMLPDKEVIVIPKGCNVTPLERDRQAFGRCLFVGSDNGPNINGLNWFLSEVWRRIREVHPQVNLDVVGTVNRSFEKNHPGVRFVGRVNDLTTYYEQAQVVIVPLLYGSGMKIKLVEALAHGKACVTTPVGLQGLNVSPGIVLCCEGSDDFGNGIIKLLEDRNLRLEFEQRSLDFARENFSAEGCYEPLAKYLTRELN